MILFSAHAVQMLAERAIDRGWVERTILAPHTVESDPTHPDRIRAFRSVPERGGRVLRVVYVLDGDDMRVVTAFLDRSRKATP